MADEAGFDAFYLTSRRRLLEQLTLMTGDREVAADVQGMGRAAFIHAADLRPPHAVDGLVEALNARFGRLDILVNNAGANRRGDFLTLTNAEWRDGFDLKFFAHVWLCRAAWPLLRQSGGSIVAIAGIGARAPVADYMIGVSVIGAELAFMKALADRGKREGRS